MNDSKRLLSSMLGDRGYEILEKAIYKQRTQAVIDPLEYYLPLIVVPRTIISWLVQTVKPMKTGEIKDVSFPGRDDIKIHFEKQDIDQYRAEFVSNGKVIHTFEKQSLPAASAHLMTVGELYDDFADKGKTDDDLIEEEVKNDPSLDEPKAEAPVVQAIMDMSNLNQESSGAIDFKEDPEKIKWEMSHSSIRELTSVIGKLIDSLTAKQMASSRLESELDKVSEKEVSGDPQKRENSQTPEEKMKADLAAEKKNPAIEDKRQTILEIRDQKAEPVQDQKGPDPKNVKIGDEAAEGKIQKDSMKESDGWKVNGSTATHPEHGSIHRNMGGDYEAHHPKLPRNSDHPNRGWANAGIHSSIDDAKAHLKSLSEKHSAIKKDSLHEASMQASKNISSPRMAGAQNDQDKQRGIEQRMQPDKGYFRKKHEILMKPYRSEAQRRWAHTAEGKKALGGDAAVHEWDQATKGKHLPEKVGKDEKQIGPSSSPSGTGGMTNAKKPAGGGEPIALLASEDSGETGRNLQHAYHQAKLKYKMLHEAGHPSQETARQGMLQAKKKFEDHNSDPKNHVPFWSKSEMTSKAEMPKGAGQPKAPKLPEPPKPPVPASNAPAASAAKQAEAAGKGNYKPPQTPGAKPPKNPMAKCGDYFRSKLGKSETVTEEQIYKTSCPDCGKPEFVKGEDGNPSFQPCACFRVLKKDEEGRPAKFVQAIKKGDGAFSLQFDPDADPEAIKVFLLTLKSRLLLNKRFKV